MGQTRGDDAITPSPLISTQIPADDFARQCSADEFAQLVDASAASQRVVLCSIQIDEAAALRAQIGDSRTESVMRELTIFVRRILRGGDAVATHGPELLVFLDTTPANAAYVAERVLASVRSHLFSTGTGSPPQRITVSIGIATAPEQGTSFLSLATAARRARSTVAEDGIADALRSSDLGLRINRFVGRSDRISTLVEALEHSLRGSRNVVAVIGDSGVGTSTLVRTLEPEIRLRGGSFVAGTCTPRALPSPYALWCDVLRAVRRLPVKTTRQWRDLPLLDPTLESAQDSASLGSSKSRLLEELADFFRLAAQQRPLVLFLEHLQWCDEASWDALEYLITQLERERILFVLTVQTDQTAEVALERWRRMSSRPRHTEIRLSFLTRDEVKRWLEAVLHGGEIGRDVMSYVYRHTEGRPLVLTHLLRDLEESGHLVSAKDGWLWNAYADLPSVVNFSGLLARRLMRLGRGAREILERACVLGREGDEMLISGGRAGEQRQDIESLVRAGLLTSTYERERTSYIVSHIEVVRLVLSQLAPARNAQLHEAIARALVADGRASAAEVAEHYEQGGNGVEAHSFALKAADRSSALHETNALVTLLGVAERTAPTPSALAEVRVRMVSVAELAGRYDEATALCDAALAWYESQGEQLKSLPLKRARALVRLKLGQGAIEILSELRTLETEAMNAGAVMERAAVLLLMAQLHYRLGNSAEAQRIAGEAVEMAESGDDVPLLADATNRLGVTIQLVNAKRARELFNQSLALAQSLGDTSRIVRALNNLGVLEMINNSMVEAEKALTTAIDIARTGGLHEAWGRAELNRGALAGRVGDYETASLAFAEALRLAGMAQNSEEQLWATVNLANLERDHERFGIAADTYSLVVELAERIGQASVQALALGGYGLCKRALGENESAREALQRSVELTGTIDEWFSGRELVVALTIYSMVEEGNAIAAVALLEESLKQSEPVDISGSAFLVAQVGDLLTPFAPGMVGEAVLRYAALPDVVRNPKMRAKFEALRARQ